MKRGKEWVHKSPIFITSFHTRQRGHIFWKEEKVNDMLQCMWKGHEFLAKDYAAAREYVHEIKDFMRG